MTMTSPLGPVGVDNGRVAEPESEPDPAARPQRRSFTPEYKAAIVAEYDALERGSPERGALLRREGLYTSHISEWRRQRDAGGLAGLASQPRRSGKSAEQRELEKLRRRNAQLEGELERTKLALDITGKAHALLAQLSESADIDPPSKK